MTLLTLSMPWPLFILLFPLCIGLFNFMARQVRLSLMALDDEQEWGRGAGNSASVAMTRLFATITCLFAAAATGLLLSPAPALERLMALLFSLYLFRMTLIDAVTGFLPREMTISCLVAGLMAALMTPGFSGHLLSAVTALSIFGVWRYVTFKIYGCECLGLGDVLLAGAIAAWLGEVNGLYALLVGVVFFVLWQLLVHRFREGGPMGPWLCAGAIWGVLIKLYQPLITW
ncbi:prepilin peptidase [Lonsdalea quercina]|uniref:prepilin peptidase n=1 Tax=Lonsdalea quercina TaxID=71657 RepID=UPI003975C418